MIACKRLERKLKTAIAASVGPPSSPSQVIGYPLLLPGLVDYLEGSVLTYLVGINQLARRDQPEIVVDQALHCDEQGALARPVLDQGTRQLSF